MASDSGSGGNTCIRNHHFAQTGVSGAGGITFSSPVAVSDSGVSAGRIAVGSSGSAFYVYEATNPNGSSPQVADECAFRVSGFAAFGAVPHASADRAAKRRGVKRAALFGTAQLVLRSGHKGVLRIKLTAAGRRALAAATRIHVRLVLQSRYDGRRTRSSWRQR